MAGRTNERMNERANEQTNERMYSYGRTNERTNVRKKKRKKERTNGRLARNCAREPMDLRHLTLYLAPCLPPSRFLSLFPSQRAIRADIAIDSSCDAMTRAHRSRGGRKNAPGGLRQHTPKIYVSPDPKRALKVAKGARGDHRRRASAEREYKYNRNSNEHS